MSEINVLSLFQTLKEYSPEELDKIKKAYQYAREKYC